MRNLIDDSTFVREVNSDAERRRDSARRHVEFRKALESLVNEYSMEKYSDTHGFVLATYLSRCLAAYEEAVVSRDKLHQNEADGDFSAGRD